MARDPWAQFKEAPAPTRAPPGVRARVDRPAQDAPSVRNAFGLGTPPPKGSRERATFDAEYNRRFNADWLASRPDEARRRAAAAKPKTREQMAREGGRELSRERSSGSGMGDALLSGIRALPGINYLTAAAQKASETVGLSNPTNASISDIVNVLSARNDADQEKSAVGYWTGALAGGGGAGKLLLGGAERAARAGVPIVSQGANVLQRLSTLRKAQPVRNAAKLLTTGGAVGALSAADRNENVVEGAAYGTAGTAALGSTLKVAQMASRPVRDFFRTTGPQSLLRRFTKASSDDIARRAEEYRQATNGAEPTLFEVLPLEDQNRLLKKAVVGRDPIVEQAAEGIRQRADNLGSEMASVARQAVEPRRASVEATMRGDLTRARGGALAPEDAALVGRAAKDPTDLFDLRDTEADAIIAPYRNVQTPPLNGLIPSAPGPNGARLELDAEMTDAIRKVAGSARSAPDKPLTVDRVVDMIKKLKKPSAAIDPNIADDAAAHLQDMLDQISPDVSRAVREMNDAWAARSRMMEGAKEGWQTQVAETLQPGTSRKTAQVIKNAYRTPEGDAGRVLGQSNRILHDFGGSSDEALRATVAMSRGGIGRELEQNLGPRASRQLVGAAQAQDRSAQALAAASRTAQGSGGSGALDGETLVQALVGLHPSTFITTKAGSIRTLMDMTYIPESRARAMVEMLFSQDPTMVRKAIGALGNTPRASEFMQYLAGIAGRGRVGETGVEESAAPVDIPVEEPVDEPGPWDQFQEAEAEIDENTPYARQVVSTLFPGIKITEDVRPEDANYGAEDSYHKRSQNAVDVRPIPGMTFEEFIETIKADGHEIIEAIDEVTNPSSGATGPHWHVVIA